MSRSVTAASRSTSVASRSAIVVSTNARNASMPSGRLCMSSRGESITQRILRGNRRFENPLYGLNTRPIEPIEQRGELDRRQPHHPVHDRRPAERSLLQLLPHQDKSAGVPDQYLQAVAALGAIHYHRASERILGQHRLRQGGERMCTFAKINGPRRQQHASSSGDIDHDREAEARTARNTAVNWAASSMPDETRTTAPASLTSIPDAADAARCTVVAGMASLTIGTKLGVVVVPATLGKSWRIARRQPKTCCEQICQRRATSDTRAPGTRVSATIRAFSSADQRRRRLSPVRTSTRRNALFASSLTSNIRIARSPVPQANQALPGRPLKKGFTAPLTIDIDVGRDEITLRYRVKSYSYEGQSVEQRVPIQWTLCRFGGERPRFVC